MPHGAIPFPFGKCRICNDKATGVHYGVATCEGCKGFYKRSIPKGEKYRCYFGGKCVINPENRNRCKSCRFKKCLDQGMAVEAVKMGRIPKLEKERALEEAATGDSEDGTSFPPTSTGMTTDISMTDSDGMTRNGSTSSTGSGSSGLHCHKRSFDESGAFDDDDMSGGFPFKMNMQQRSAAANNQPPAPPPHSLPASGGFSSEGEMTIKMEVLDTQFPDSGYSNNACAQNSQSSAYGQGAMQRQTSMGGGATNPPTTLQQQKPQFPGAAFPFTQNGMKQPGMGESGCRPDGAYAGMENRVNNTSTTAATRPFHAHSASGASNGSYAAPPNHDASLANGFGTNSYRMSNSSQTNSSSFVPPHSVGTGFKSENDSSFSWFTQSPMTNGDKTGSGSQGGPNATNGRRECRGVAGSNRLPEQGAPFNGNPPFSKTVSETVPTNSHGHAKLSCGNGSGGGSGGGGGMDVNMDSDLTRNGTNNHSHNHDGAAGFGSPSHNLEGDGGLLSRGNIQAVVRRQSEGSNKFNQELMSVLMQQVIGENNHENKERLLRKLARSCSQETLHCSLEILQAATNSQSNTHVNSPPFLAASTAPTDCKAIPAAPSVPSVLSQRTPSSGFGSLNKGEAPSMRDTLTFSQSNSVCAASSFSGSFANNSNGFGFASTQQLMTGQGQGQSQGQAFQRWNQNSNSGGVGGGCLATQQQKHQQFGSDMYEGCGPNKFQEPHPLQFQPGSSSRQAPLGGSFPTSIPSQPSAVDSSMFKDEDDLFSLLNGEQPQPSVLNSQHNVFSSGNSSSGSAGQNFLSSNSNNGGPGQNFLSNNSSNSDGAGQNFPSHDNNCSSNNASEKFRLSSSAPSSVLSSQVSESDSLPQEDSLDSIQPMAIGPAVEGDDTLDIQSCTLDMNYLCQEQLRDVNESNISDAQSPMSGRSECSHSATGSPPVPNYIEDPQMKEAVESLDVGYHRTFEVTKLRALRDKHLARKREGVTVNVPPTLFDLEAMYKVIIESIAGINKKVLEFCRIAPGFCSLDPNDQEILLKRAYYDIWMLTSSEYFVDGESYLYAGDNDDGDGIYYVRWQMEQIIGKHQTQLLHNFADQFNTLGLTNLEVAILCCIQLTAPGHDQHADLKDVKEIQKLNSFFLDLLVAVVSHIHSDTCSRVLVDIFRLMPLLQEVNRLQREIIANFSINELPTEFGEETGGEGGGEDAEEKPDSLDQPQEAKLSEAVAGISAE